jgi:hypothetical protein
LSSRWLIIAMKHSSLRQILVSLGRIVEYLQWRAKVFLQTQFWPYFFLFRNLSASKFQEICIFSVYSVSKNCKIRLKLAQLGASYVNM